MTATDGALGEALAKSRSSSRPSATTSKARTRAMIGVHRAAFADNLAALSWMDAETRARAREGRPDREQDRLSRTRWRDYDALERRPPQRTSATCIARRGFEIAAPAEPRSASRSTAREWLMTPPTVNAYYNPLAATRSCSRPASCSRRSSRRRRRRRELRRHRHGRSATSSRTASTTRAASSTPTATCATGGPPAVAEEFERSAQPASCEQFDGYAVADDDARQRQAHAGREHRRPRRPQAGLCGLSRDASKLTPHDPYRSLHHRPAVLHLFRPVVVHEAAARSRTPSCQRRPAFTTARPRQRSDRELGGVRRGVLVPDGQPDGATDALRGVVTAGSFNVLLAFQ